MGNWSPIIAALVAVVGWYANHQLSVRAQKKNFQNQLRDRARMEIARAVHDYQSWLESLSMGCLDAKYGIDRDEHWIGTDLEGNREPMKYFRDISQPSRAWVVRMEEYEMVFPETRTIRKDLELRHQRLSLSVMRLRHRLFAAGLNDRPKRQRYGPKVEAPSEQERAADAENARLKALVEEVEKEVQNHESLIDSLMVYLQNAALRELFDDGRKVPEPAPDRPDSDVVTLSSEGQLVVKKHSEVLALRPGVVARE